MFEQALRAHFGHSSFMPGQEEVVRSILEHRDTLAVFPTGSGKSICYQLPAMLLPNVTVVVSPLIALMKDQLDALRVMGVEGVAMLHSGISRDEAEAVVANVEAGRIRLLYTTPERLLTEPLQEALWSSGVSLLAVDEAHCVSRWGPSFRPAYLHVAQAARALGSPPILALTATASPPLRADIVERLAMRDPHIIVHGFDRPNLSFEAKVVATEDAKNRELVSALAKMPGSGLIYVATVKETESVAELVRGAGRNALSYHGRMNGGLRTQIQESFMQANDTIVVATGAFGLGVDKADVRFVIHYDLPETMETYYQEAGRAGRDGQPASCLLLFEPHDMDLRRFLIVQNHHNEKYLKHVWNSIRALMRMHASETFDQDELTDSLNQSDAKMSTAIDIFLEAGLVTLDEDGRIRPLQHAKGELRQAGELAKLRKAYDMSMLDVVERYAHVEHCRREFILNYFGEAFTEHNCQNCDSCRRGLALAAETGCAADARTTMDPAAGPFVAGAIVRHARWGRGSVQRLENDAIVVLFDQIGYKTLDLGLVLGRNLLVPQASA